MNKQHALVSAFGRLIIAAIFKLTKHFRKDLNSEFHVNQRNERRDRIDCWHGIDTRLPMLKSDRSRISAQSFQKLSFFQNLASQ
jgi:hypothetical protein